MAQREPQRLSSRRHRRSHRRHSSADDVRLEDPQPSMDELRQMRSDYYAVSPDERRRQNDALADQRRRDKAAREETEAGKRKRHRHRSSAQSSSTRPPRQAGDEDEHGYTFVYGSSAQPPRQGAEPSAAPREHRRRSSVAGVSEDTTSRRRRSTREVPSTSARKPASREAPPPQRPPLHRSHTTSARSQVRLREGFVGDGKKEGKKPAATSSKKQPAGPTGFDDFLAWMFQRKRPAPPRSIHKEKEREKPLMNGICAVCRGDCLYTTSPSTNSEGVKLSCGCVWCNDCLKDVFHRSLEDRTLMPPRCCPAYGEIRRKLVWHLFWPDDVRFLRRWVKRYEQWKTDKGVICPVKGCSNYITQRRIEAQEAGPRKPLVCSKCSTKICMKCRNIAHGDKRCPKPIDDPDEYAFDALAANEHWQQCPSCKIRVSKEEGCNHMTCVCGTEFCFLCGRKWHQEGCSCPYYTAQDMPPPMDFDAVRRFAQELEAQELEAFFIHFQRQFLQQL